MSEKPETDVSWADPVGNYCQDGHPEQTVQFLKMPEQSDWQCKVAGINYIPRKGEEPNAFWRLTQLLILGVRWEKR